MRYIPKSSEVLQALQDSIGKQIAEREEQKKNYVPTPVEIKPLIPQHFDLTLFISS